MISIKASHKGARCRLSIRGHAGYHPGCDIVCAGVSAIAFALLGWLSNNPESITETRRSQWSEGSVELDILGDKGLRTAFQMAVIGLWQIAGQYPDNVQISGKSFEEF